MRAEAAAAGLSRVVEAVVGFILASIVIIALAEVVFRYVIQQSLVWAVELNRFLFIWLTFLAAAAAVHRRLHFRLTLLWRALGPGGRARLELATDVVVFAFALVLLIQGLEIVGRTSVQRSSALLLSMSYVYSVIPASAVLTLGFIVLRWASAIQEGRLPDPLEEMHQEAAIDDTLPSRAIEV